MIVNAVIRIPCTTPYLTNKQTAQGDGKQILMSRANFRRTVNCQDSNTPQALAHRRAGSTAVTDAFSVATSCVYSARFAVSLFFTAKRYVSSRTNCTNPHLRRSAGGVCYSCRFCDHSLYIAWCFRRAIDRLAAGDAMLTTTAPTFAILAIMGGLSSDWGSTFH